MSWLRIDDGFTEHRKVVGLKRSERWTWLEVLAYCARQQNDGVLPDGITDVLKHVNSAFLSRCISLGLLDVEGGRMKVHDWALYNPKDPTKAERQARWRAKNRDPVDGDVDAPVDAGVDANGRLQNRLHDGTPSPPVPSRTTTPTHPTPSTEDPEPQGKGGREESEEEEVLPGDVFQEIPW